MKIKTARESICSIVNSDLLSTFSESESETGKQLDKLTISFSLAHTMNFGTGEITKLCSSLPQSPFARHSHRQNNEWEMEGRKSEDTKTFLYRVNSEEPG